MQTSSAMCLGVCRTGTNPREVDGVVSVTGSVVLVDLDADPDTLTAALRGVRIYAGRAGWDAQQLIDEVVEGAWYVVPGLPDDVLAGPRTDLWFTVLRRQPFPLAFVAYHPGDLARN